jgi:hypothetical protein
LRICINSSIKQPLLSGVYLNNCLLKGPPALADLYRVMLGVVSREWPSPRTSQSFAGVWKQMRQSSTREESCRGLAIPAKRELFVITKVNYRDRPVG